MVCMESIIAERRWIILKTLTKDYQVTSRIVHKTGLHLYVVKDILELLKKDGKVQMRKEANRTYWKKKEVKR